MEKRKSFTARVSNSDISVVQPVAGRHIDYITLTLSNNNNNSIQLFMCRVSTSPIMDTAQRTYNNNKKAKLLSIKMF
jgi:hypothetical protein